ASRGLTRIVQSLLHQLAQCLELFVVRFLKPLYILIQLSDIALKRDDLVLLSEARQSRQSQNEQAGGLPHVSTPFVGHLAAPLHPFSPTARARSARAGFADSSLRSRPCKPGVLFRS